MKSLLIVCILSICLFTHGVQTDNYGYKVLNDSYRDSIRINTIKDTIYNIIDGRDFLYYTKGHNWHIWSIVVPADDYSILLAGDTRIYNLKLDTINNEESIISWGIDSLKIYSHEILSERKKSYWPFYEQLTVYSADKEILFDCNNEYYYRYLGSDSMLFNKKLERLKYFMYWYALPADIQKRLPAPL